MTYKRIREIKEKLKFKSNVAIIKKLNDLEEEINESILEYEYYKEELIKRFPELNNSNLDLVINTSNKNVKILDL